MTIVNGYITVPQLQAGLGTQSLDSGDPQLQPYDIAINAASRLMDDWTGRVFYPTTEARQFRPTTRCVVDCGDLVTTASIAVATDDNADGVFETAWTSDQWQTEPLVIVNGWPARQVTTTSRTREFPIDSRRPRVQITGTWGWTEPPGEVVQATLAMAVLLYRMKDLTGADYGIELRAIDRPSGDPISVCQDLVRKLAVPGGLLWTPPPTPGQEAA